MRKIIDCHCRKTFFEFEAWFFKRLHVFLIDMLPIEKSENIIMAVRKKHFSHCISDGPNKESIHLIGTWASL